jgi:hypothetical protein
LDAKKWFHLFPEVWTEITLREYYCAMGKAVKNPPRRGAANPREIPNKETRGAMESLDSGEGVVCKDVDDLLKKLKS